MSNKLFALLIMVPLLIFLDAIITYLILKNGLGIEANFFAGLLTKETLVIYNALFAANILFFVFYCKKKSKALQTKHIFFTKKVQISHFDLIVNVLLCLGAVRLFAVLNNSVLLITKSKAITNYIVDWSDMSPNLVVILIYIFIFLMTFVFIFLRQKKHC